mmetsp:Transcript_23231/g.65999  ORF Transcript_23231/g.65999 Transcript_23231/m.65999 type:complete len:269 (-) Transcript_23231:488-1294(-)
MWLLLQLPELRNDAWQALATLGLQMQHAGALVGVEERVDPQDGGAAAAHRAHHRIGQSSRKLRPNDEENVASFCCPHDGLVLVYGLIVRLIKPQNLGPLPHATPVTLGQALGLLILGRLRRRVDGGVHQLEVRRVIQVNPLQARTLDPLVAAHLVDAPVNLAQPGRVRAGLLVQAVDVLGHQQEVALERALQVHEGMMPRIGRSLRANTPAVLVPSPKLFGHLVKLLPGCQLLGAVVLRAHRPVAVGSAEGRDAAFGGHAGAREHDEP